MSAHYTYSGILKNSIHISPYFKAELTPFILNTENDFTMIEHFKNNPNLPVCISVLEQYQLIENIIKQLEERIENIEYILIQLNFPGSVKLPKKLLEEKILITINFDILLSNLIKNKKTCFTIKNSLIKNRNEDGQNQIKFDLYNFEAINQFENFRYCVDYVSKYGFEEII